MGELGMLVVSFLDLAEEAAAYDASAAPHQRDSAEVQIPALLLRRFAQQHIALGIGDDLRAVERAPHVPDELLAVHAYRTHRGPQDLRSRHALFFHRRETARKHGFADQGHWRTQIQGADAGPLSRTFLAGRVQNLFDHRRSIVILLGEDLAGDFYQVADDLTLVPIRK